MQLVSPRHMPENPFVPLNRLIGQIYDAIGDNERWIELLSQLNAYFCSKTTILEISPGDEPYKSHFFAVGELSEPEHIAEWVNRSEPEKLILKLAPGEVQICNDFGAIGVPPKLVNLLQKYSVAKFMSCCLAINDGRQLFFHTVRSTHAPTYSSTEADTLRLIADHLGRAMNQHLRLSRLSQATRFGSDVISEFGVGIVLATRSGEIELINPQAKRIVSHGNLLCVRNNSLTLSCPRETKQLSEMINSALHYLDNGSTRVAHIGAMRATSSDDNHACNIAVTSVPLGNFPFRAPERTAVLYVDDGVRQRYSKEALQGMFGLTHAETNIAAAVLDGHDFTEIPGLLNIKQSTLRFHLNSIYEKLGARNKGQMIAILMLARPFLNAPPIHKPTKEK